MMKEEKGGVVQNGEKRVVDDALREPEIRAVPKKHR